MMQQNVLSLDLIKEIVYKQILVLLSREGGDWEEGVGGNWQAFSQQAVRTVHLESTRA